MTHQVLYTEYILLYFFFSKEDVEPKKYCIAIQMNDTIDLLKTLS